MAISMVSFKDSFSVESSAFETSGNNAKHPMIK
jgi:hypothetical protein